MADTDLNEHASWLAAAEEQVASIEALPFVVGPIGFGYSDKTSDNKVYCAVSCCWTHSRPVMFFLQSVSPSAVGKLEIMVNLSDLSVKQLRKSFKYAQIFRRLRRA